MRVINNFQGFEKGNFLFSGSRSADHDPTRNMNETVSFFKFLSSINPFIEPRIVNGNGSISSSLLAEMTRRLYSRGFDQSILARRVL